MKNLTFPQDMFEHGPLMFVLIDNNSIIIQSNSTFKEFFEEKLIGNKIYSILHEKSKSELSLNIDLAKKNGKIECELTLKNNKVVKVNINSIKEKNTIKYFKLYLYDVTEYERKYKTIFDVGEIAVWNLNTVTNIIESSTNINTLFNTAYPIKSYKEFLSFINETEQDRVNQLIKTGIKKQKFNVMFKLNIERYILMKCKMDGNNLISVCWDITDKMLSTKHMHENMRKLEQNNEELEQFAYIASHDLREPLMGIAGFASLFKRRYSDKKIGDDYIVDEKGMGYIDTILGSCKKMGVKMDDLLAWSRSARGDSQVFDAVFDLNDALEEAKFNLNGKLSSNECQISTIGKLPQVRGSKTMISQVFQNILGNALKYKKKNEMAKIEIKVTELNNIYCVSIKDNGIGFDQKHSTRIFSAFQRLHGVEDYSGTGIGLAIAKKIIDKHGGEIWATSELDVGSVFNFTLKKSSTTIN